MDSEDLLGQAREVAGLRLSQLGRRWAHVQCVGAVAEGLPLRESERWVLSASAWLHDVGYAPELALTGFHPLDGARWLRAEGWPTPIVSLVAHHSGAAWEARERGLADQLAEFDLPDPDDLDVLTFTDMTSSPTGERVTAHERIREILSRYPDTDPVNRAVRQSSTELLASVRRTIDRFGLPNEGFTAAA